MSKVVKIDLQIRGPEVFIRALRDIFGQEAVEVLQAETIREAIQAASQGKGLARRAYGGAAFRDAVAVVRTGTPYAVSLRKEGGVEKIQGQVPYSDLALVAREDGSVELVADHFTDQRLLTALRAAYIRGLMEKAAQKAASRRTRGGRMYRVLDHAIEGKEIVVRVEVW
jgi:hypothetical protein